MKNCVPGWWPGTVALLPHQAAVGGPPEPGLKKRRAQPHATDDVDQRRSNTEVGPGHENWHADARLHALHVSEDENLIDALSRLVSALRCTS